MPAIVGEALDVRRFAKGFPNLAKGRVDDLLRYIDWYGVSGDLSIGAVVHFQGFMAKLPLIEKTRIRPKNYM
jgi:hypothetical protein